MPIPSRSAPAPVTASIRRRDRHGRGLRGPLLPPHLPRRWPQVGSIQFAVEEVPPSDPAPWEHGVVLGRGFAARPRAGLPSRIVVYRRPLASRAQDDAELTELVRRVVVEQVALMLGRSPEEIDPEA